MRRFFESLYACLVSGGRAVLQVASLLHPVRLCGRCLLYCPLHMQPHSPAYPFQSLAHEHVSLSLASTK